MAADDTKPIGEVTARSAAQAKAPVESKPQQPQAAAAVAKPQEQAAKIDTRDKVSFSPDLADETGEGKRAKSGVPDFAANYQNKADAPAADVNAGEKQDDKEKAREKNDAAENKAKELEDAEKEEQLKNLEEKIENTQKKLEEAQKNNDPAAVQELEKELQGLTRQRANLLDQPQPVQPSFSGGGGGGEAPAGGIPAGGGGGGAASPMGGAGGVPPMGAAGAPPYQGGGGFPAYNGQPDGQGLHYPNNIDQLPVTPADPNAKIPDFGGSANKEQIGQMLEAAAKKYGIPPDLLKAVAWQESTWNSKALSFDGQHGKGVMQIDDRFHQFAKTSDAFNPSKNIDYGAKYLSGLYKETGNWQSALKRYNGGSDYPPKIFALAQQKPWQGK
jgi:chemotaxis protein histidine kinase CheA